LNRILNESKLKDQILASVQRLLLSSIAEYNIFIQKTCHILFDLPLYHSSWQFVFLNLSKEAPRWIRGTGKSKESSTVNDSG